MKEEKNDTLAIAKKYHLTDCTVRFRAKALGIKPVRSGHQFIYTEEDSEKIGNYTRKKSFLNKVPLNHRFAVINLFLSMKDNRVINISKATGISLATCNYIINDYLKNGKSIVIESKMNYF